MVSEDKVADEFKAKLQKDISTAVSTYSKMKVRAMAVVVFVSKHPAASIPLFHSSEASTRTKRAHAHHLPSAHAHHPMEQGIQPPSKNAKMTDVVLQILAHQIKVGRGSTKVAAMWDFLLRVSDPVLVSIINATTENFKCVPIPMTQSCARRC
jgi:hypothetical protein